MKENKPTANKIFEAKRQRRKELAKLTIEEKVKILVQLQKIVIPILAARGHKRKAWVL